MESNTMFDVKAAAKSMLLLPFFVSNGSTVLGSVQVIRRL